MPDRPPDASAEQLTQRFVARVVEHEEAFTLLAGRDYPVFPMHGAEVTPLWALRSDAERVRRTHEPYQAFRVARVGFDELVEGVLPELGEQGVLAGLNWSGNDLFGVDVSPEMLIAALREARPITKP